MGKIEDILKDVVRYCVEKDVRDQACTFFFYQPKVSENLKQRLQETKKQK